MNPDDFSTVGQSRLQEWSTGLRYAARDVGDKALVAVAQHLLAAPVPRPVASDLMKEVPELRHSTESVYQ